MMGFSLALSLPPASLSDSFPFLENPKTRLTCLSSRGVSTSFLCVTFSSVTYTVALYLDLRPPFQLEKALQMLPA